MGKMLGRNGVSNVFIESYPLPPSPRRLWPSQPERPLKNVTGSAPGRSCPGWCILPSPLLLTGMPGPSNVDRCSFVLLLFCFPKAQSLDKTTATGQHTWKLVSFKWLYPCMLWPSYCLQHQLSSGGRWPPYNKNHSGLWPLDSPERLTPACVGEEGSQLKPLKNPEPRNGLSSVQEVRTELRQLINKGNNSHSPNLLNSTRFIFQGTHILSPKGFMGLIA